MSRPRPLPADPAAWRTLDWSTYWLRVMAAIDALDGDERARLVIRLEDLTLAPFDSEGFSIIRWRDRVLDRIHWSELITDRPDQSIPAAAPHWLRQLAERRGVALPTGTDP